VTWQLGGLNFQTVHHLFPDVSHIHYPKIQKIVIETCVEFKVQYNHYKTMLQAEFDHMIHLWEMGRKPVVV
jgi:linoleoyl-CoA desaturase